ncbi:hypothetical protein [Fibrella forsythiae]|uniref:Uncharacterized protein n=1 Tax=Fibrella forsythiae TaxID=2817061 RepID=A0ABS3JSB6_9BACT|nr:hypothetical protein [Fibrella forsythiae]MBO0952909.1 hypothetical protein [Fibrella forsythiae]
MKCTACQAPDGRPVFRTNPPGQTPAGWLCRTCIEAHHDASLIDADIGKLVDLLAGPVVPPSPAIEADSVLTCSSQAIAPIIAP